MNKITVLSLSIALAILASCAGNDQNLPQGEDTISSQIQEDRFIETPTDELMLEDENTENIDSTQDVIFDNSISEINSVNDEYESDELMNGEQIETMELSGNYVDYSEDLVGSSDDTVIFFHASWCPSCSAADEGISASKIPENLSILKADFDTSIDLRKKYGVTAQHTFVFVDSDGEMIKKWVGGTNVDDILERIN